MNKTKSQYEKSNFKFGNNTQCFFAKREENDFTYQELSITQCIIIIGDMFEKETTYPKDNKIVYVDDKEILYYLYYGELSSTLFGLDFSRPALSPEKLKDKGQRKVCGCMISKDIGQYNTCLHQCVYCYANTSKEVVVKNWTKHLKNPFSATIIEV